MRQMLIQSLVLIFVLGSSQDPPAPEKAEELAVGSTAPSLRLNDQTGNATKLFDDKDRWTVLAFYPKAATPG